MTRTHDSQEAIELVSGQRSRMVLGVEVEEAIVKEKVPLGSGGGEVEFANYEPQDFERENGKVTFVGHSKSGTDFKLTYDGSGNSRRCSAPGAGSCPADGDWGGLE